MLKNITVLVAHPDDEIIFCWPAFELFNVKNIIVCSDDSNNPERPYGTRRRDAFIEACVFLGAEPVIIAGPSEFYRMETRPKACLKDHLRTILDAVGSEGALFTHNPWGEYGHLDHIMVNQVAMHSGLPHYFTDCYQSRNWVPWARAPQNIPGCIGSAQQNYERYSAVEKIYRKYDAWTWDCPPTVKTFIHRGVG